MNFVDIWIPLPELVTKANQLVVQYTRDTLKVQVKGEKAAILDGKTFGPLRVDDCTWVIEEPDGVHERFESDDSDSDSEESSSRSRRKVLHMEMAKFDNDQITKDLQKGFWLGVMAAGPLMPAPKSLPPDYYDTWLNDKEVRPLFFSLPSCRGADGLSRRAACGETAPERTIANSDETRQLQRARHSDNGVGLSARCLVLLKEQQHRDEREVEDAIEDQRPHDGVRHAHPIGRRRQHQKDTGGGSDGDGPQRQPHAHAAAQVTREPGLAAPPPPGCQQESRSRQPKTRGLRVQRPLAQPRQQPRSNPGSRSQSSRRPRI